MDGQTAVTTIAANRAVELGVVVVTAVGNERQELWEHIIAPSDGFYVLAVGAVTSEGNLASFSSPGPTADGRIKPEVCALGVDNWLAANDLGGSDIYGRGDGTSFATPLVAGVCALLLEANPAWTPLQVYAALTSTAGQSDSPDNDYGWGIVNAFLAAEVGFALLTCKSYLVDDDDSGASQGNGNGLIEPGETIELSIVLRNDSSVEAASPQVKLSSLHPLIHILQEDLNFASIAPFDSAQSVNSAVVKIPGYLRGNKLVLRLEIKGPNALTRTESIRLPISWY
jgi:hypothetical protein